MLLVEQPTLLTCTGYPLWKKIKIKQRHILTKLLAKRGEESQIVCLYQHRFEWHLIMNSWGKIWISWRWLIWISFLREIFKQKNVKFVDVFTKGGVPPLYWCLVDFLFSLHVPTCPHVAIHFPTCQSGYQFPSQDNRYIPLQSTLFFVGQDEGFYHKPWNHKPNFTERFW